MEIPNDCLALAKDKPWGLWRLTLGEGSGTQARLLPAMAGVLLAWGQEFIADLRRIHLQQSGQHRT